MRSKAKSGLILLLVLGLTLSGVPVMQPHTSTAQDAPDDLVNLDHLRFLTEPIIVNGQEMAVVHIYSEYPDYEWVDAAGEGLSAVDDVARAAVVYLWQYERTRDMELLNLAKLCLNFVLYMQAPDGEFYNFVTDKSGTINERGGTSYKSLGWWAMRGLWAIGEGVRVFDTVDVAYADQLAEAYLKTETALGATLTNYGEYTSHHGYEIPAWIPGGEPDVASIGLLGLAAYYQARPNPTTEQIMTQIADGLAEYRLGNHLEYPFGMHPALSNAPGFWHDWGAHTTHALVVAGLTLNRQDWIDSSAAAADSFLLRQLVLERFRHIGVVPYRLEQIAYGTNMLVLTYTTLYQATGEARYARYAGTAASWYFGNNMAGVQIYDPDTGRVLDGINGPVAWRVNRNSGAESTIEGLMSMIAIADLPAALDLIYARTLESTPHFILEAESAERVIGTPTYFSTTWTGEGYVSAGRYIGLGEGQRMRLQFELEQAGDYWLYVAHVRQSASNTANQIRRAVSPPTIDADPSDWPADVPVLAADTAQQFLRGAGIWQGPEVDSHEVRLTWDDQNLYLLATVRDPKHEQPFTLSNAWQGDTLWIYFTHQADATRLSAKFTLAQTPDGPQTWDWIHTEFLEGAQLAWQPQDAGYIYEAAIPWVSLDVEQPAAGLSIGFEAGRGIGGNSFMDLTGRDPDVAANLMKLVLVEPDMDMSTLSSAPVALSVRLDDGDRATLQESVSPDSDYFWLDLLTANPVTLSTGEHTIRFEYAGDPAENPGLSKIDAFYLQPVVARRVFQTPDGRTFTLTYNTQTGESTWEEK